MANTENTWFGAQDQSQVSNTTTVAQRRTRESPQHEALKTEYLEKVSLSNTEQRLRIRTEIESIFVAVFYGQ